MAANRPRSLQVYDPVLSNLARAYRPEGFIARDLFPTIPVKKLSGQYPVFPLEWWFRKQTDNKVKDRAPAPEIDFEWSTDGFLAEEYALKVSITDLEREQAIAELHLEREKTEFLTEQMELSFEIQVANLLRRESDGGQIPDAHSAAASVKWDQEGALIEDEIKEGVLHMRRTIGVMPNQIEIPFEVAYAMALNPDIRELMQFDHSGKPVNFIELGGRLLPRVIHGMEVKIAGAMYDPSNEGSAQAELQDIWGDRVLLLYTARRAGWGKPSAGYRFQHTPKRVTRWRETDPDLEYIREKERYDLKLVAPDAVYEIRETLTSS